MNVRELRRVMEGMPDTAQVTVIFWGADQMKYKEPAEIARVDPDTSELIISAYEEGSE